MRTRKTPADPFRGLLLGFSCAPTFGGRRYLQERTPAGLVCVQENKAAAHSCRGLLLPFSCAPLDAVQERKDPGGACVRTYRKSKSPTLSGSSVSLVSPMPRWRPYRMERTHPGGACVRTGKASADASRAPPLLVFLFPHHGTSTSSVVHLSITNPFPSRNGVRNQ